MSHLLRIACLRLNLSWKPRSENDLADQLTNGEFSCFDSDLRIQVSLTDLPLQLFNKLLETKNQFMSDREHHRLHAPAAAPAKKTKTQW